MILSYFLNLFCMCILDNCCNKFLGDSDADIEETTEPKRGRGITTMETFWPIVENVKLKVDYNEHFQPVGPYASKLANVIGNLAKGKVLSLAYEDWTDVPNKDDVWDNVKVQSSSFYSTL